MLFIFVDLLLLKLRSLKFIMFEFFVLFVMFRLLMMMFMFLRDEVVGAVLHFSVETEKKKHKLID